MKAKDYFAVIPVYNEQKHIKKLLEKVRRHTKNIIVVNDGSKDNTRQILEKIRYIKVINLPQNEGKGAAMKKGAELAWKNKAKGIVFLDGDNQHNPSFLPHFFKYLDNGHDVVIGIRILKTKVPIYRKMGNLLLMATVKILFKISIPDLLCGYRGLSKKGYNQIIWNSTDYGVETEMISRLGKRKLKYATIIVDTIYLDKYKGFSIKDGLKIFIKIPFWKLN